MEIQRIREPTVREGRVCGADDRYFSDANDRKTMIGKCVDDRAFNERVHLSRDNKGEPGRARYDSSRR